MMINTKRKMTGILIGILVLAVISRFDSIIAPSVAEIQKSFPEADPSEVESIVSIGGSAAMVSAILFGKLLEKLSFKVVALFGAFCIAIGGLAPIFFHRSVTILLLFAIITGFGTGILTTVLPSLSAHFFKDEKLSGLLGKIVAVQDGSSMIVMYIGGLLAMHSWVHNYYIYGLSILAIGAILLFIPNEHSTGDVEESVEIEDKDSTKKQHLISILICLFLGFLSIFLVAVLYNKLAIYINDFRLGGSDTSGTALMFNTGSSIVVGLSVNYIKRFFKGWTLSFGFVLIGIGAILFLLIPSFIIVCLAAFLIGSGSGIIMTNVPYILSNLALPKKYPFIMGCFSAITSLGFTASTWVFKGVTSLFNLDPLLGTFKAMAIISFTVAIILVIVRFSEKVQKNYL